MKVFGVNECLDINEFNYFATIVGNAFEYLGGNTFVIKASTGDVVWMWIPKIEMVCRYIGAA